MTKPKQTEETTSSPQETSDSTLESLVNSPYYDEEESDDDDYDFDDDEYADEDDDIDTESKDDIDDEDDEDDDEDVDDDEDEDDEDEDDDDDTIEDSSVSDEDDEEDEDVDDEDDDEDDDDDDDDEDDDDEEDDDEDEEDDEDDEDDEDEDEDEDDEKSALELSPPGELAASDPAWVLSFVGRRGPFLVFFFAFLLLSIFAGDRLFRQSDNPHYVLLSDVLLRGQWHLRGAPRHPVTGKALGNDWASYYMLSVQGADKKTKVLKGMYETRGGYPIFNARRLRRAYRFRTLKGKLYYLQKRKGAAHLDPRSIRARRKVYFVSFPPTPAFLMMPAMWTLQKLGYDRLRYNDTIFSVFFSALAIFFMFSLLQQMSLTGHSQRTLYENLLLTFLFGFGTVFFYVSVQGTVWFTALSIGALFSILYLKNALDLRQPFWAGVFLAAAFLCRPLLLLSGLFFVWQWARRDGEWDISFDGDRLKELALFLLPLAVAIGGIMWVNNMRFGNPFEFGHRYLPAVYYKATQYGLFHPRFFLRNFYANFLSLPFGTKAVVVGGKKVMQWKLLFNGHGASLFFTTPAFLLLFWGGYKTWSSRNEQLSFRGLPPMKLTMPLFWILVAVIVFMFVPLFRTQALIALAVLVVWTLMSGNGMEGHEALADRPWHPLFPVLIMMVLIVGVPPVFYQNSGWFTFGNRFSVDYTPYLILLLAISNIRLRGPVFAFLLLFAVVVNAFGAITFNRNGAFYDGSYGSLSWLEYKHKIFWRLIKAKFGG
tara:strand:- start:117 stop:2411 length:2295 start_codon:yes stop_codon:yes gene_type:complete